MPKYRVFWSVFSRIWTEYKNLLRKSRYSVQIRENMDQENYVFEHFSWKVLPWKNPPGSLLAYSFSSFFFEKQSVAFWLVIRYSSYWSSSPEMFCKKGALRIFAKSTAKHLSQSLRPANLLEIDSGTGGFLWTLETPFFTEYLWWLLLFLIFNGVMLIIFLSLFILMINRTSLSL